MDFLKFSATNIFTGEEMLSHENVLIVTKEGVIKDIITTENAGENVLKLNGTITPGFINCHCHLELSNLKSKINKGTGMVEFILQILQQRNSYNEILQEAISIADVEMQQNGIVAVGDICNTTDTLTCKLSSPIYYHNFIEVSGFLPLKANEKFLNAKAVYNQFYTHFPAQTSMVPHAPYSVSTSLFNEIKTFSANKILSIHNQESEDENLFFKEKKGSFNHLYKALNININFFKATLKTSFLSVVSHLKNNATILVHNGFLTNEDAAYIKKHNSSFTHKFWLCLCVLANDYIGNLSPKENLVNDNIEQIVIGTDSLASNENLNIVKEINSIKQHYPAIEYLNLLKAATLNGAKALGIDDKYGNLKIGLKPGVFLINNDNSVTNLLHLNT